MARLSKSKAFAIYEDNGVQDVENVIPEQGEATELNDDDEGASDSKDGRTLSILHHEIQEEETHEAVHDGEDEEADNERRESTLTSTTVSSFPDSYYWTENDDVSHTYQTYTPPLIRTRFRRPESVKRMQMASPPPYGYRSPRMSILSHSRSRAGRPRSVRSVNARGSPRTKIKSLEGDDLEQKHYPLVLLHVSLLPPDAPWSLETMQHILPAETLANLQLLRSKLSETVLRRGLLIPHPREEYELLEARFLEALELKTERLTKCGHFHGRSSEVSEHSGAQSDSGIGSSSDSSDDELCAICQRYVQQSKSGVTSGDKKWMIRVYAANGLMRSSAWAAAWADMERVDVEIMPWISDEVRRSLDELKAQEDAEKQRLLQDQEIRIEQIVERKVRIALEERLSGLVGPFDKQVSVPNSPHTEVIPESRRIEPPTDDRVTALGTGDLPQIYKPSQIPISVLLKNYIYLLLQNRRNLVVLGLSIAVLFYAVAFNTTQNNRAVALVPGDTTASTTGTPPLSNLADQMLQSDKLHLAKDADSEPGVSPSYFSTEADVTPTEIPTDEQYMLNDLGGGQETEPEDAF